ncbi:ankyrin repeat domain-containing protein [Candidatus Babeliales bacterium]|nr:ankyrin repeat domain-containing protein [Candidatus Babeliales bacterium]
MIKKIFVTFLLLLLSVDVTWASFAHAIDLSFTCKVLNKLPRWDMSTDKEGKKHLADLEIELKKLDVESAKKLAQGMWEKELFSWGNEKDNIRCLVDYMNLFKNYGGDPKTKWFLFFCVKKRYQGAVKWLCDEGADVNQVDDENLPVLVEAMIYGTNEIITSLLEKSDKVASNILNLALEYSKKLNHRRCFYVRMDIDNFQLLIDKGADVNKKCWDRFFLTYVVIDYSYPLSDKKKDEAQLDLIKFLIEKKAQVDSNILSTLNNFRFDLKKMNKDFEDILIHGGADLLKTKNGHEVCMNSLPQWNHQYRNSWEEYLVELEEALKQDASQVNAMVQDHILTSVENMNRRKDTEPFDRFKLLIKYRADVNAGFKYGQTVLNYFIGQKDVDAVAWLCRKGALLNTVNQNGKTPLLEALSTSSYKFEVVEKLIEYCKPVDVNVKKDGRLLLSWLFLEYSNNIRSTQVRYVGGDQRESLKKIIKLLIETGAKVEPDALHCIFDHSSTITAFLSDEPLLDLLISAGVDLNARNHWFFGQHLIDRLPEGDQKTFFEKFLKKKKELGYQLTLEEQDSIDNMSNKEFMNLCKKKSEEADALAISKDKKSELQFSIVCMAISFAADLNFFTPPVLLLEDEKDETANELNKNNYEKSEPKKKERVASKKTDASRFAKIKHYMVEYVKDLRHPTEHKILLVSALFVIRAILEMKND